MGVFGVTSGAEHAGVSACLSDPVRIPNQQCIYVIEALNLRYVRPVSRKWMPKSGAEKFSR